MGGTQAAAKGEKLRFIASLDAKECNGNGKPKSLMGQCLHAKKIGFVHPVTGEYLEFDSELPEYFKKFLNGKTKV